MSKQPKNDSTIRVSKDIKKLILQARSKIELQTGVRTSFEDAVEQALKVFNERSYFENGEWK